MATANLTAASGNFAFLETTQMPPPTAPDQLVLAPAQSGIGAAAYLPLASKLVPESVVIGLKAKSATQEAPIMPMTFPCATCVV